VVALCNEQGQCEQHYLEGFPCVGQFPAPSAADNRSLCQKPVCEGAQCVMRPLAMGANCTPPNATACEQWSCTSVGYCVRNATGCVIKRPPGSHTWIAVGAAAGVAFALLGLAALAIARVAGGSSVPIGAQADTAAATSMQSPLYQPMGLEAVNPLYSGGGGGLAATGVGPAP